MSQFMVCKAEVDLGQFGGILLDSKDKSNAFILPMLEQYYPESPYDNIWVINNMEEYCCKQLRANEFAVSDLYFLLNNLYDICDWMIFWYGSEYDDLDEVCSKDELIRYVQKHMEEPCCELYVRVIK